MKCSKCNEEVNPGVSFCGNCGSKIEKPLDRGTEESPKSPENEEAPQAASSVKTSNAPKAVASEPPPPTQASVSPPPPPLPPQAAAAEPGYVPVDRYQPLGIGKYLLAIFVFSIPLVNVIMMIVWAIGSKNINLRNFAIAALLWLVIIIVVTVALSAAIGVFFSMYFEQIMDYILNAF